MTNPGFLFTEPECPASKAALAELLALNAVMRAEREASSDSVSPAGPVLHIVR